MIERSSGSAPVRPPGTEGRVGREPNSAEQALDRLTLFLSGTAPRYAAVALCLLALLSYQPQADPDVFHRVATGRLVELHGGVVDADPFAFTPKHRWIDHEWLSGVVFYQIARRGEDTALVAFNLAAMLITLLLVTRAQRLHSRPDDPLTPWLFLTMVAAFGVWTSVVRSQIFTFLGLGAMLVVLVEWRRGRAAWLWLLPPVFCAWANFHGGFVAGLGLLGLAAVAVTLIEGRRSLPLWGTLGASVLATLLNPYGVDYWPFILNAVTMERPGIGEWTGLPILSLRAALLTSLLAVFVWGGLRGERRPPPEAWALVAATCLATFSARRFLSIYLVVMAVYGGPCLRVLIDRIRARRSRLWLATTRVIAPVWCGLVLYAGLQAVRHLAEYAAHGGLRMDRYAVGAMEWLETTGEGGNLLVHFNQGSYALWRLHPRYRVSVDGRYEEVYTQETVDRVAAAIDPDAPGHGDALAALAPDYILAATADDFGSDWTAVYRDELYSVLARPGVGSRAEPIPLRPLWTPDF